MSLPTQAPNQAPYSSVVGLLAVFPDGSVAQFSGALIAPDEVLTAAHGVWDEGVGAATAVIALTGTVPEANTAIGSELLVQSGTYAETIHFNAVQDADDSITAGQSQSDIALIHFGTPLAGAAAFQLGATALTGATAIQIAGLPDGGSEVTETGVVAPLGTGGGVPAVLTGTVTLGPGSSGGPIWTVGANGAAVLVGTVSSDLYAAEITAGSAAEIASWEAQDATASVANTATAAGGAARVTLAGSNSVLTSFGQDTIQADAGLGVIYAAGRTDSILGGAGQLIVIGGQGLDTVRPGSGSATIYGGSGGGVFDAGFGGGSVLVAGSGASTLVGGGTGDVLFGSPGASTAAAAGAGAETIVGGGGAETLAGGSGTTVAFAGTGPDVFTAYEALGGTLLVVGFRPGDRLDLEPDDGGRATSVAGAYGSTVTFDNGARVVLYGVSQPASVLV